MKYSRSIRFKLITLYVGLLTVVFICFGAYTYYGFHRFLIHSFDQTLTRRAQQIASTILEELPDRGIAYVAGEIQARYAPELNERVIRITDANGQRIYASANANLLSPYIRGLTPGGGVEGKLLYRDEAQDHGQSLRVVSLNHRLANGLVYTVEVGGPENDIATALNGLLITLGIGCPVLIGLSILGGYSLMGRVLRPVDRIVRAAEQITFKNLSQRLPVSPTGDEFERISMALNRMIQRLEEAFQIANRFAADASHELRTPLTIIQGELEVLVKSPTLTSEINQRVADMLEEVERLTRIVEGLLLVSRLEAGEAHMSLATLDLGELVNSTADQVELLSEDKLLTVKREISQNVLVEGDAARLRQVVVNLLDNAIKYTPEGGAILLKVGSNETHALLEVADSGIGIQPSALPHVFNRFFRAEEARASRITGTGLGLSIVQSITEAHGGKVMAESNGKAGSQFRVELPLLRPGKPGNGSQLARGIMLALALVGTASCSQPAATTPGDTGKSDAPGDVSTVAVAKVTRCSVAKGVNLTAEFLPWQEVEIHAKVAGYVKQINVDVGDHAKLGDVLATLEIPEIEDELKQADAAVLTAQAEVQSMQAAYDESTQMANRMNAAAKETQGLIAQQDLDTANDKNRGDEANLEAAKQKVTEAQANAEHLRDMVAYSTIIAPFVGVVTRRYADKGALVQAGTVQAGTSANSNSMPLVSFAEMDRLRLEFPVPESDVPYVHLGDSVEVNVLALHKTFEGKVSRFAQKVDTSTRTMLTEVDVDNPDYAYTPGMYATVKLTLEQKDNALTIPIQSLNPGDKPSVMVVRDNKIEKQDVTIGLETPDQVEILDGLEEGDLVVVGNRSALQVGQAANPKLVDNQNP